MRGLCLRPPDPRINKERGEDFEMRSGRVPYIVCGSKPCFPSSGRRPIAKTVSWRYM
ncbi:hypothetical protein ACP70R_003710 [Stipagrostis hirtigluma subsp. patula]